MALFTSNCTHCGSREHASADCPQVGLFSSKCARCGSLEHATSDCHHPLFSTKCNNCGSVEHPTEACPQDFLEKKCSICGSTEHPTSNCIHGPLSTKCAICGSPNHKTSDCSGALFSGGRASKTSTTSTSDDSGLTGLVGGLIGVILVVLLAIWLALNVVIPLVLLNSALILTILAFVITHRKVLFAVLALAGGVYMLMDSINGWFSQNFVQNVTGDTVWISGFIYINAAALGVSAWILIDPLWKRAKAMLISDRRKGVLLVITSILAIALVSISPPLLYHASSPFVSGVNNNEANIVVNEPTIQPNPNNISTIQPQYESSNDDPSDNIEQQVKARLRAFFSDLESQSLTAQNHFANNVDQYISIKNTTPAIINENLERWSYPEYRNYESHIRPNSFLILFSDGFNHKVEFIQEISCYRVSKETNWEIVVLVEVDLNSDFRITRWIEKEVIKSSQKQIDSPT